MYLTSYTFTGDSTDLINRYDQLLARYRDEVLLHVAVTTETGLVVYDACPDQATAEAFRVSPEWCDALGSVGLAMPVATGLGEIHAAISSVSVAA